MAERIINLCRASNIGMSVKIKPPTSRPQQVQTQNSSSLVEEINLKFKVQLKWHQFRVAQEGNSNATTLVGQYTTRRLPLVAYRLPIAIFNHDDETLTQYLSWQLERYDDIINIQIVAEEILKHWVKVREEGNSSVFEKIYPLQVTMEFCNFEMHYDARQRRPSSMIGNVNFDRMVPTREDAMEKMLKRVEIGDDESCCVICLEEMTKKEEEKIVIMEMPCLHLFHEECIKKWLKTSHCCPTCRFSMPTK